MRCSLKVEEEIGVARKNLLTDYIPSSLGTLLTNVYSFVLGGGAACRHLNGDLLTMSVRLRDAMYRPLSVSGISSQPHDSLDEFLLC